MKLALIFMTCFVGLSYQQRYIWPMPYAPRAHLLPLFYADGKPADDIESLPEVKEIDNQPKAEQVADGQEKFLFNLPILSNLVSGLPALTTVTSTSVATSTSVVSTPTTIKCIPSTIFATPATITACARRRRAIEDVLNLQVPKEAIEPAQPIPLEVSAVETIAEGKEGAAPEIESSQLNTSPESDSKLSDERLLLNYQATKTLVIPSTSIVFSFAAATIKSTVLLATTSQLVCLPANYVVC